MKKTLLAVALLATVSAANAADGWKSSVELGTVLTSGNTQTQSLNAKGGTEYIKGKSRTTVSLTALSVTGKDNSNGQFQRLAERFTGEGKTAYQYTKHSYAFLASTGVRDIFSGFAYQFSATAGYGYRALDTAKYVLDFEAGPGYRQTRLSGEKTDVSTAIAHVAVNGKWNISKTSALTEDFVTEGSDYFLTQSVTALSAKIKENLSMKLSLTIKNNSKPPAGKVGTDSETAVTLVYTM